MLQVTRRPRPPSRAIRRRRPRHPGGRSAHRRELQNVATRHQILRALRRDTAVRRTVRRLRLRVRVPRRFFAASLTRRKRGFGKGPQPREEELRVGFGRAVDDGVGAARCVGGCHADVARADDHVPSSHPLARGADLSVGERRRVPRALAGEGLDLALRDCVPRVRVEVERPVVEPADGSIVLVSVTIPVVRRPQRSLVLLADGSHDFRLALDRATRDGGCLVLLEVIVVVLLLLVLRLVLLLVILEVVVVLRRAGCWVVGIVRGGCQIAQHGRCRPKFEKLDGSREE